MIDPAGDLLRRVLAGWLAGPTAVGKTEVALALAERHGWVILSVDSRQIYRGLDLGSAKPTPAEQGRVPHLLIDVLDPRESCSAGRYRTLALSALAELSAQGRRALAVGGAGLYWEALTRPLHPLPPGSPEIRAAHAHLLATEGTAALHARLREVDPTTAERLAVGDRQRVSRALEVFEVSGRPLSSWLAEPRGDSTDLPVVALQRDREDLRRRLEQRGEAMLEAGLLTEIRGLLAAGVPADAPGLRSVGYREFLPHLLGGEPLAACRERFLQHSWQYAKRQLTWLRGRVAGARPVLWSAGESTNSVAAAVEDALAAPPRGAHEPS